MVRCSMRLAVLWRTGLKSLGHPLTWVLVLALASTTGLSVSGSALGYMITVGDPSNQDQIGPHSPWQLTIPQSWDESGCLAYSDPPELNGELGVFTPGQFKLWAGPVIEGYGDLEEAREELEGNEGYGGVPKGYPLVSMTAPITALTFGPQNANLGDLAPLAINAGEGFYYADRFRCFTSFEPLVYVHAKTEVHVLCDDESEGPGPGYDEMSVVLKVKLAALYAVLESEKACYKLSFGFRSPGRQGELWNDWHAIADRYPDDVRTKAQICAALQKAHFKQCPSGYSADGEAKGGPALSSDHTAGTTADIGVEFSGTNAIEESWSELVQAVHKVPGLCSPPKSDPVHVYLPNSSGVCKF